MGWQDHHLQSFEIGGEWYGMQFDEYPEGELDEKAFTVLGAVEGCGRFTYEYDFGDCWEHEVTVEALWRMPIGPKHDACLDEENACPPEDSGGAGGDEDLLRVLDDPSHEDTSTCAVGSVVPSTPRARPAARERTAAGRSLSVRPCRLGRTQDACGGVPGGPGGLTPRSVRSTVPGRSATTEAPPPVTSARRSACRRPRWCSMWRMARAQGARYVDARAGA